MKSHTNNGVQFYTFESLDRAGLNAAVFTRNGGVSTAPWATLNVGGTVGDDTQRVSENRYRAFSAVYRTPSTMFDVWQVHSNDVVCTDHPRPLNEGYQKADAIFTDNNNVTLFMRFADCVPVLLYDPVQKVIGLVHSGWIGTVNRVVATAIERMRTHYGSNPSDLFSCIGPSICANHYPVGSEVVTKVANSFGQRAYEVLHPKGEKSHFDLWRANQIILQDAGVDQVEISGICTACNLNEWFSHRGEKGKTGRFGVLFALDK
jgi:YfiH family protein